MLQHGPLDAEAPLLFPWSAPLSRRQNAWDIPLDEPLTLQSIWTMFGHLLVTRYLIVASFALGFYDYFLTLPHERAYLWKSRPSVIRSIYFFVRYSYFPIGVLTLYGQSSVASAVNVAYLASNNPTCAPPVYTPAGPPWHVSEHYPARSRILLYEANTVYLVARLSTCGSLTASSTPQRKQDQLHLAVSTTLYV